jgi:hypothetical protein
MDDDLDRTPELTGEDLEAETAAELPDREAMSIIAGSGIPYGGVVPIMPPIQTDGPEA